MTKTRKKRKGRGAGTGYGSKKKHRGGGSRGGRGFGGSHKHKYSYVTTKDPSHFGYKGFHSLKKKIRTINVSELKKLHDSLKTEDRVGNEIDLTKLGYGKLLSRGKINRAFTIKVENATERAKKKLEEAGGTLTVADKKAEEVEDEKEKEGEDEEWEDVEEESEEDGGEENEDQEESEEGNKRENE